MDIKKYEADIADVAAHEVEAYRAIESRRFDQATAHAALATAIASRAALEAMRPVELTIGDPNFESEAVEALRPEDKPYGTDSALADWVEVNLGVTLKPWQRQLLEGYRPSEPIRPGQVPVDEQTLDADEVAKVGRDTTAARRQVRLELVRQRYDRTGSTTDAGDGAYAEYWSGPLGIVRVDWKARS